MNKTQQVSMVQYGVVTFLDVLGWKGVWQRKDNAISELENIVSTVKKKAEIRERGKSTEITSVMIVSDTIVLFTPAEYDNAKEKIEFHGELCAEAIPSSIKKGLPLRGATSFGEVIISSKNNIFAGKAIDEAASWHEKANWIGVFLTPSANFLFTDFDSKYWISYKPPIKNSIDDYATYSAVWFDGKGIDDALNEIKKDFTQLAPIVPEIVGKFTNTIMYIEFVRVKQTQP